MVNKFLQLTLTLCVVLASASITQAQVYLCSQCGQYHALPQYAAQAGLSAREVNRDTAAYAHAKREATILARRGFGGHPLGVAPGARYAGTGSSFSANSPNHCYDHWPESRLVARAVVQVGNKFWWSAHYR